MPHNNCIFCKILNGEIPSAKVYEDQHVYAFLDLSQVTKGHTLIIPKTHVKNIYEATPTIASDLFISVPIIANAIKKAFNPQGMNLINNNEEFADQSVFHLHIHLIPRYDSTDGYESKWITHQNDYDENRLQEISKAIGSYIEQDLSNK